MIYKVSEDNKLIKLDVDSSMPVGSLIAFAGRFAPDKWLICDGSSLSRAEYPELYAVIGTSYGADDLDTFRLPDLRESVPVGIGQTDYHNVNEHDTYELGEFKDDQMATHTHTQQAHTHTQNAHTHTQNAHTHTFTGSEATTNTMGSHTHTYGTPNGSWQHHSGIWVDGEFSWKNNLYNTNTTSSSGSHSHTVTATGTNSNTTATNQNTTAVNQNTTAVNNNTGAEHGGTHGKRLGVNYIIKVRRG